jgi:hypothetical protein
MQHVGEYKRLDTDVNLNEQTTGSFSGAYRLVTSHPQKGGKRRRSADLMAS